MDQQQVWMVKPGGPATPIANQQNAALVKEIAATADSLNSPENKLVQTVAVFKLS